MCATGHLRRLVRGSLRRFGLDLVSFHPRYHPVARRFQLLRHHGIDVVLDVGANVGQYAVQLRENGFAGSIVSFEPVSAAFAALEARARGDRQWRTVRLALGDARASAVINVSANLQSSSLLGMLPLHLSNAPESAYQSREEIEVRRLDAVFGDYAQDRSRVFLKIDAQGYERRIIEGAAGCLDRISGIQAEVSLVPMYDGEASLNELLQYMEGLGFVPMSFEPTFGDDRSGRLLQMDCLFFRP
jgi:FkbM family methyltransferase